MLAQNFKTPTDLGVTDAEFDALFKVLGMLERGEIKDLPKGVFGWRPTTQETGFALTKFNMSLVSFETDCGTAGCILGWARHVANRRIIDDANKVTHPLYQLFFGTGGLGANTAQAAIALRSMLTHGEPRWAEAMAG